MQCPDCKKTMIAQFGCVISNVKWICSCGYATKYKKLSSVILRD